MESNHAIFVAIILGNVTPTTVYCIIGIDFAINVYHALNIVHVYNHRNDVHPYGNDDDEVNQGKWIGKDCNKQLFLNS